MPEFPRWIYRCRVVSKRPVAGTVGRLLVPKLEKRLLINDRLLPVVLHAGSRVADLTGCPITNRGLPSLSLCTRLKKLCLSTDLGSNTFSETRLLECFQCFHELEWLELVGIEAVTTEVVKVIAEQNENLTVLKLKECNGIGDPCLRLLGLHCHRLKAINLSSTLITSQGITALLEGACRLTLEEFIGDRCLHLDDHGIVQLVINCPKLRILSVAGCPTFKNVHAAFDRIRPKNQLFWSWSIS
uniref:F-box domain-containing protein n=1 Tax=Amblyomma maculatum TaxID=34609 RepID=G3MRM8_AMBMU